MYDGKFRFRNYVVPAFFLSCSLIFRFLVRRTRVAQLITINVAFLVILLSKYNSISRSKMELEEPIVPALYLVSRRHEKLEDALANLIKKAINKPIKLLKYSFGANVSENNKD